MNLYEINYYNGVAMGLCISTSLVFIIWLIKYFKHRHEYRLDELPELLKEYIGYEPYIYRVPHQNCVEIYLSHGYYSQFKTRTFRGDVWVRLPGKLENIFLEPFAYRCLPCDFDSSCVEESRPLYDALEIFKHITGESDDYEFFNRIPFHSTVGKSMNEKPNFSELQILDSELAQSIYDYEREYELYEEKMIQNIFRIRCS